MTYEIDESKIQFMREVKEGMEARNFFQLLDWLGLPDYQGGYQRTMRWNKVVKILAEKGLKPVRVPRSQKIKIEAID